MWMIDIARPLARLFYRVFYNLKVFGVENVPDKGGFIIASNHLSFHDPVIIAAFIKNGYVSFLAKQELFKNKLIGFFLKYLGAIPINRGARDAAAVKNAVDFIRAGNGLCIFPEGTRVKNGKEIRPKKGAVRMSQMSGVPIIPVHIKGYRS
jgi:1-acyl-sn-glycerol-3-phosphate acyltransferase